MVPTEQPRMPLGARLRRFFVGRTGNSVGFFAATMGLVSVVRVHAPIHLDTARDLLIARDCVVGVACAGAGPRTSFGGWTQGALWSHVLELREALGLGVGVLEWVANLALAVSAALVPLVARSMDRRPNALTWAVWFSLTLLSINYPTLWNPTLLPLALALFAAAVFVAARTRSSAVFVAAAATLAIAVDLHVVSALLVPLLLAAIVACASRPIVAVPAAAAIMVTVLVISSPGASAANWPLIMKRTPVVVGVLLSAAIAGAAARRKLTALEGAARATLLARAICIYLLCLLPLLAAVAGHALRMRYLGPLVTPAAVLLSTRSDRRVPRAWVRGASVALVLVGFAAFAVLERVINTGFRMVEVERVAATLYGRGTSYDDLYRHLRGPDAVKLLAALAAFEPPGSRSRGDERDLFVVRAERRDLPHEAPPGWTFIDLGARHVAVIVPYRPWLQVESLEVCRGSAEPTCETVTVNARSLANRSGMRWADRAYPSLLGRRRPARGQRVSYRLQLAPVPGEPAREVRLVADECQGGRIGGAPGDGRSLRVEADAGVRVLEFTVVSGSGCRWWLPPLVEVTEGDELMHRLVRGRQ